MGHFKLILIEKCLRNLQGVYLGRRKLLKDAIKGTPLVPAVLEVVKHLIDKLAKKWIPLPLLVGVRWCTPHCLAFKLY